MLVEVPYYDDSPKYQILVFGERDDPAAYFLRQKKGAQPTILPWKLNALGRLTLRGSESILRATRSS